jgi:hypothetical protein
MQYNFGNGITSCLVTLHLDVHLVAMRDRRGRDCVRTFLFGGDVDCRLGVGKERETERERERQREKYGSHKSVCKTAKTAHQLALLSIVANTIKQSSVVAGAQRCSGSSRIANGS